MWYFSKLKCITKLTFMVLLSIVIMAPNAYSAEADAIGKIAFTSNYGGKNNIWVINTDGTNPIKLTEMLSDELADSASWSPDGKRIVFTKYRHSSANLWVINADGTHSVNLTNDYGYTHDPSWSPDGKKIAFSLMNGQNGLSEIWEINSNGTNPNRLIEGNKGYSYPAWSPNGKKIAFSSGHSNHYDIWVMKADGTKPVKLTNKDEYTKVSPSWSPDGKMIAYSAHKFYGLPTGDIWVMRANGTNLVNLTNDEANNKYNNKPTWSPDGNNIAFASIYKRRNVWMFNIWVMSKDGLRRKMLTNEPISQWGPAWQPLTPILQ